MLQRTSAIIAIHNEVFYDLMVHSKVVSDNMSFIDSNLLRTLKLFVEKKPPWFVDSFSGLTRNNYFWYYLSPEIQPVHNTENKTNKQTNTAINKQTTTTAIQCIRPDCNHQFSYILPWRSYQLTLIQRHVGRGLGFQVLFFRWCLVHRIPITCHIASLIVVDSVLFVALFSFCFTT